MQLKHSDGHQGFAGPVSWVLMAVPMWHRVSLRASRPSIFDQVGPAWAIVIYYIRTYPSTYKYDIEIIASRNSLLARGAPAVLPGQ